MRRAKTPVKWICPKCGFMASQYYPDENGKMQMRPFPPFKRCFNDREKLRPMTKAEQKQAAAALH